MSISLANPNSLAFFNYRYIPFPPSQSYALALLSHSFSPPNPPLYNRLQVYKLLLHLKLFDLRHAAFYFSDTGSIAGMSAGKFRNRASITS